MDLSQMQLNSLVLYKMYPSFPGEVSRVQTVQYSTVSTFLFSWLQEDNVLNKLNLLHRNKYIRKDK